MDSNEVADPHPTHDPPKSCCETIAAGLGQHYNMHVVCPEIDACRVYDIFNLSLTSAQLESRLDGEGMFVSSVRRHDR